MVQLIRSGIMPLDERMGGLVPKRTYVLTGAPGTGKTVACLEFLEAAMEAGETAAILTHDDPTDLIAEAEFLGIDLEKHLADERIVLLRYQLDFIRRFARAASPETAFAELRTLLGRVPPARLVIDSVAPVLEAGAASGGGIQALLGFLEASGATAMVTYPGDLAGLYDRRLERLVQSAGAILHFSCDSARGHRIEIRKVRYSVPSAAPIPFHIQAREGIVGMSDEQRRRASDLTRTDADKLIVIDTARAFPDELLASLRGSYHVTMRHTLQSAFADLAMGGAAVLVDVRRDTVNDALTLVRELRRAGNHSPVALVTQFTLRADDRARALRAGADEFLSADVHPLEFLARIQATIERGHVSPPVAEDQEPLITQPRGNGKGYDLFDAHAFRNAVNAHLAGDRAPFFTLVVLKPTAPGATLRLGEVLLRALRVESGDLAGYLEGAVAVYLHAARRRDAGPFVERVKEEWRRTGLGDLAVEVATHPVEEHRVIDLLSADWADVAVGMLAPDENGGSLGPRSGNGDGRTTSTPPAVLELLSPPASENGAPSRPFDQGTDAESR